MTWEDFSSALQLISEERVGSRVRAAIRQEDAGIAQTKAELRRQQLEKL